MPHRGNNSKNAILSHREIANFRKFTKIYTCKNIYVHSIQTYIILSTIGYIPCQIKIISVLSTPKYQAYYKPEIKSHLLPL